MSFEACFILLACLLSLGQIQADTVLQITSTSVEERSPAVSPDGNQLAFLTNREYGDPNQLGVLNLSDGTARVVSSGLNLQDGIAWKDDQTVLAGDAYREGGRIIAIDVETGSISTLHENESRVAFVSLGVSPDTLLFSRLNESSHALPDEPNFAIWLLSLATGEAKQLFDSPARDVQPMALRSGEISFFSRKDTMGLSDEIYALDPQTGKVRRLLVHEGDDFGPAPSPDGQWIAFANNAGGAAALFLLNLDSGKVSSLLAIDKRLSQPAWSPDGRYLYFVAREAGSAADIYRLSIEAGPPG